MRKDGVEAACFRSARDREQGLNVAVFDVRVFGGAKPRAFVNWYAAATRQRVEFRKRDFLRPAFLSFPRQDFLVRGVLPAPAL